MKDDELNRDITRLRRTCPPTCPPKLQRRRKPWRRRATSAGSADLSTVALAKVEALIGPTAVKPWGSTDDFALRSRCCAGNPYAKMETGNVVGRETNENAPAF